VSSFCWPCGREIDESLLAPEHPCCVCGEPLGFAGYCYGCDDNDR
jgi:hypothetical protein